MLQRIFKAKGKKKNKGSVPELGGQAITDAHERVNLAMGKDHGHDQERSESTSLGRFPAAEENLDDVGLMNALKAGLKLTLNIDTTHFPVLKADDDARVGSLSTMDKGDSARNAAGQGTASRDEDKIAILLRLHLTTPNFSRTLQISRSKTAHSTAQEEISMLRTITGTLYSLELHMPTGLALTRQKPVWKARGPRSWMKSRAGSPPPTQLLRRFSGFQVPPVRASPLLLTASLDGYHTPRKTLPYHCA
ncbi:hypothetical protein JOM56_000175 [Amanita muscaria]